MPRCDVSIILFIILFAIGLHWLASTFAQTPAAGTDDAIRVRVTLNVDGSRTVYQFDNAKHEATATTSEPDGKPRGKIVYQVSDAGRFVSGVAFGPDEKFLFKSVYKYDAGGRLEQETHLTSENSVINRIAYRYDPKGKQIGYSVFDASGKLISGTASPSPTASPSKPRNVLGH